MTGAGTPPEAPPELRAALDGVLERIRSGDNEAALAQCEALAGRFPQHADPLHLTGYLYQLKGAHERAIAWFERAARAAPDNAEIFNNYASSLKNLQRFGEAEELYRRALSLDPENGIAHYNFADLLLLVERPAEALARSRNAIELLPRLAAAHRLAGFALQAQGRREEAIEAFRASAASGTERPQAQVCEALAVLHHGDYGPGWELYEARLEVPDMQCLHEHFGYPRWRGASLAQRTLLVCREQGIGDEIMFATCLPDLLQVARRCIVTCEPRLQALFARSFPAATFLSGSEAEIRARLQGEKVDFQIPAGSLPSVFRQAAEDFPARDAHLAADPARVEYWRAHLAALGPGPKLGLAWRAGGQRTGGQRRSLPLEALAPLLELPGAHWISLQHDAQAAGDIARVAGSIPGTRIAHWPEVLASYDDTAALLAALDLSVSVCGSIVHLAGAIGRPVWVMVPWLAEWRYGESGESMAWYRSPRLFRQLAYGDWPPVVERLRRELQARFPS